MTNYAVIDDQTGTIVNRIVLDDPAQWDAPTGHSIVEEKETPLEIGGNYVNGVYTPPYLPPPVSPV